jgi:uncharacterized repeat protein (TIGR01451 family)
LKLTDWSVIALFLLAAPVAADSIRELSLPTNDLVYDPASGLILASVPGRAGPGGNSITRIDPVTGEIVGSVFVGSEPGPLALTDDGQYLYVGLNGAASVRRYTVASQTPGLQFPVLGTVTRLAAIAGEPSSVAVISGNYSDTYLSVFSNGVARNSRFTYPDGRYSDVVTSLSPARLYSGRYDELTRIAVTADRFDSVDAQGTRLQGFAESGNRFQAGLLFSGSGAVLDPEARQLLGTLDRIGTVNSPAAICPDLPGGRIFALVPVSSGFELRAYDARTYTLLGSMAVPYPLPQPNWGNWPGNLIRCGTDGLAYRVNDRVYVLHTSLVAPQHPRIDLEVSGSAPSVVRAGETWTYTVTVRNQGEAAATFASLTDTLPPTAVVETVSASQGQVYTSDRVLTARLGELAVGATATLTVSVRFTVPGPTEHQVVATAFETDVDPADDRLTGTVQVGAPALPELNAEWAGLKVTCPPGGKCRYQGKLVVRNQGGQPAKRFTVRFYRSEHPWVDFSTVKLAEVKVAQLKGGKSATVKLNTKNYPGWPYYYVIAEVDAGQVIPEANEGDNQAASGQLVSPNLAPEVRSIRRLPARGGLF